MEQRQRAAQLAVARAAADAAEAAEAAAEAADKAAAEGADGPQTELTTSEAVAAQEAGSDADAASAQASPAHEPSPPTNQRAAATSSKRARRDKAESASPPPVEDEAAYMQWLLALQEQEQGISATDAVKQRKRARTQVLDPSMYNEPTRVRSGRRPQAPRQHKPKVGLWAVCVDCCVCRLPSWFTHVHVLSGSSCQARNATRRNSTSPCGVPAKAHRVQATKRRQVCCYYLCWSFGLCKCLLVEPRWLHAPHPTTPARVMRRRMSDARSRVCPTHRTSCARERRATRLQAAPAPALTRPLPQQAGESRESRKRRNDTRQLLRGTGEGDVSDLITWKELKVWLGLLLWGRAQDPCFCCSLWILGVFVGFLGRCLDIFRYKDGLCMRLSVSHRAALHASSRPTPSSSNLDAAECIPGASLPSMPLTPTISLSRCSAACMQQRAVHKASCAQYVGETVRKEVAERREKVYEACGLGSSYLFRVDHQWVVDATVKVRW